MDNNFDNILDSAINRCNNKYDTTFGSSRFNAIYPFTTENINGYIREFDLDNKSLLTIGSSLDQVINSSYFNCKDITVIDICPFTKYYFYLKKAALIELNYVDFLSFFCYKNYPVTFVNNEDAFDINLYNQVKGLLSELDNEAYLFWNELFLQFKPLDIRRSLFNMDEDKVFTLRNTNAYLYDKYTFNETKDKIKDITPKIIYGDITKIEINDKFDNIWFSNIGTYYHTLDLKSLVEKYDNNLNIDGKMLICYLYDTVRNSKYTKDWATIYNLDKTYEVLGNYISDFVSFTGVKGILHDDTSIKDSILVYKKVKKDQNFILDSNLFAF